MTADLSALIARLEAAEAGARFTDSDAIEFAKALVLPHRATVIRGLARRALNGSLDAALALAERLGCGRTYVLDNAIQTTGRALPTAHLWNDDGKHTGHARTMSLALCIAILRAKQGEGE